MSLPLHYLEIIVVVLGLIILLADAFAPRAHKSVLGWGAIGGLLITFILLFFTKDSTGTEIDRFYSSDINARFFKGLTLIITMLVLLMAIDYRKILARFTENPKSEEGIGEFYALPVFACAGMMWMASAKDLVMAFVALELTTITFYVLVAYMRRNVGSLEAGVKYLILGALSTGFLVYGIAWIYGITGSMELSVISDRIASGELNDNATPVFFGISLIIIALAFKVGAAPMHLWIPDVYQGAPTPTTAFLSIGSKAAGFIVALRILEPFLNNELTHDKTVFILTILAAVTLLVGNLAAINQGNLKRLLAYSSIANAGFLLLAIAAWQVSTPDHLSSFQVVGFYLATYLVMTIAALFALQSISQSTGSESIKSLNGLVHSHPALAWSLTIIFSALAGLPLTIGFWGKFFVFQAAIDKGLWIAIGAGFIGVAVGFYYYLKVISAMFWSTNDDKTLEIRVSVLTRAVVYPAAVLIIVLGFFPQPILSLLGN